MTISTRIVLTGFATAVVVVGSAAAAQAATASGPSDAQVVHAARETHLRAVSGSFAYEMTATPGTITDVEVFGAVRDGHGTSARPEVRPDAIKSMGFVAGGTSFDTGVSGAHLSGVAGDDVTSITVIPATGAPVRAVVDHGVWAAAWQGDPDADAGRATVRFVTKDGRRHVTSTDDIDWIAAAQKADDAG